MSHSSRTANLESGMNQSQVIPTSSQTRMVVPTSSIKVTKHTAEIGSYQTSKYYGKTRSHTSRDNNKRLSNKLNGQPFYSFMASNRLRLSESIATKRNLTHKSLC